MTVSIVKPGRNNNRFYLFFLTALPVISVTVIIIATIIGVVLYTLIQMKEGIGSGTNTIEVQKSETNEETPDE
jgi:hypothetical protein